MIRVAGRRSPLSMTQIDEVEALIRETHPEVTFERILLDTVGDRDRQTSLRALDKTDFFTKEIDQLLLNGECQVGIHSAKDLPEPLPEGLSVIAFTKGVDPSDSLVLGKGHTLESLRPGAVIATSSERREEMVRALRSDLTFIDVRGNIGERIALVECGEVDGVVIAEAALIRLKLTHLNRVTLPGETVPMQGRLAIVARTEDTEMKTLFACIHHEEDAVSRS